MLPSKIPLEEAKKVLGPSFQEKIYLERLLASEYMRIMSVCSSKRNRKNDLKFTNLWTESINSTFSKNSKIIRDIIKNELSYLNKQYDIHTRMNYMDSLQGITSEAANQLKTWRYFHWREQMVRSAEVLDEIWRLYLTSHFEEGAYLGVYALKQLDTWPGTKPKSSKWRFQADMCHAIGLCLDGLGKPRKALLFFEMDARLAEHGKIMLAKKRALDNIGRMYACMGKYKEALTCWTQRLKTNIEGEELAWLLYHIALCQIMIEDYKEALRYARLCTKIAEVDSLLNWSLCSNLLVATITALVGSETPNDSQNLQTSLISLESAYSNALQMDDHNAINYVLNLIRHIYDMVLKDKNTSFLSQCWSAKLMELLRQDFTNRGQLINA